jgi:hypothetical protein
MFTHIYTTLNQQSVVAVCSPFRNRNCNNIDMQRRQHFASHHNNTSKLIIDLIRNYTTSTITTQQQQSYNNNIRTLLTKTKHWNFWLYAGCLSSACYSLQQYASAYLFSPIQLIFFHYYTLYRCCCSHTFVFVLYFVWFYRNFNYNWL